jgi:hypothetical protein
MADPKPHIFDGTKWLPLQGEDGAPGPAVVSADAGNVCKLGADGRISVQPADMDARWVNVTGDTMTGALTVRASTSPAAPDGLITVSADGTVGQVSIKTQRDTTGPSVLRLYRTRGSAAVPATLKTNDQIGQFIYSSVRTDGTFANAGQITLTSLADVDQNASIPAQFDIKVGNGTGQTQIITANSTGVGINWTTPTKSLEVLGDTMCRGPLEVTGNITSAGTAHSFAANSIAASDILGLPAAATVAPLADASVASVGTSTAYARQDHVHPLPLLKADDLSDVTVTAPATGQVLRFNGGQFVNAVLAYSDLTGTPAPSAVAGLADTFSGTVGTSTAYARADHTHPYPPAVLVTASRGIAPSDMGRLLVNAYTGTNTNTPIKFTLPPAADQAIPVGSWFDLCDASVNSPTAIASPDGVNLLWNASLTGGSATTFAGGTLSTLKINGMFSRLKVLKTAPLIWIVLG